MKKYFRMMLCISFIVVSTVCLLPVFNVKAAGNNNLQKLDEYLNKYKNATPVPGFSVVVVSKDKIIFNKGYGVEVAGENSPMTEDSITKIGSLAESLTSLAVMQLVEQGKVKLDDPVIKYLPWFRTADSKNGSDITVRMLLSNTSGLPSTDGLIHAPDDSDNAMEKAVRSISSQTLRSKPGEAFEYSNVGIDIAGLIIEAVTGMRYSDYMQKYVLEPLKMDRSTTDVKKFDSLKVLYGHNPGIDGAMPAGKYVDTTHLAAGSEFRSTAKDIGHYLIALLNGGKYEGRSVISEDSINEMWTPVIIFPTEASDLSDYSRAQYCLGWRSSFINARTVIEHHGNALSASSYTMIYPAKKVAVAVLFNIGTVDKYRYWTIDRLTNSILNIVCDEYVQDIMTPGIKDPSVNEYEFPEELKQKYAGDYITQNGSLKLTVYEDQKHGIAVILKDTMHTSVSKLIFASPYSAYFKNISYTYPVQFKISYGDSVTGIDVETVGGFIKQSSNNIDKNKNMWQALGIAALAIAGIITMLAGRYLRKEGK